MTGGSARSVGARATRLREQAGAREELGRGVGCWRGREREVVETGWAAGVDVGRGWKLGLGCYGFPPLFYFLIQTNSNQTILFEFKFRI